MFWYFGFFNPILTSTIKFFLFSFSAKLKTRQSCTHAIVVDILIYINNHYGQCISKWKCDRISSPGDLANIRSEQSGEKLKNVGCQKIQDAKQWIQIGKLDENVNQEGIFWLDANTDSKDCIIPSEVFERPIHI